MVPYTKFLAMKYVVLISLVLAGYTTRCQNVDAVTGPGQVTYFDASGSPFLFTSWNEGWIRFASGRSTNQFKLKFDCLKNQLLLQFNGNSFSTESKVKEFVIYPKGNRNDSMVFKKGYPGIEPANEETFYQVVFQDKISLLHLYGKIVMEEQQLVAKEIRRHIRDENKFYIYSNNKMILIPEDKLAIPALFGDQSAEIRQFINDKQLKFRDPADYLQLAQYYNSLLTAR